MRSNVLRAARILSGLGILAAAASVAPLAQPRETVAIDKDDIGGVVSGPKGPEAGVWVIAETRDLGVRYIKSVVTDDRGRYVVPDLPAAKYQVWARGYGLVDSAKTAATPGQQLNITAVPAPSEAEAAKYYPAIYWYSMLKIPGPDEFGGKAHDIAPRLTEQRQWIAAMKNTGCIGCHQLGQESTRTIPPSLGTFANGADAWKRRVQSGQSGAMMHGQLTNLGERAFANYGEWTDRVAKGDLPFAKPVAPPGRRAQHRRHAARLDGREALSPRPHLERSPASHGECERPAVWLAGVQLRPAADSRPGQERGHHVQGAGPRSADAAEPRAGARRRPRSDDAVALLGQRADLGDARQQPQLDVRQGRPVVAGRVGARRRQPGVVQGRLLPSVGQGVPDGPRRPSSGGPRPEDDEVRLRRDLLLDAPSAVRLRRQRHALDEWRWSGGGVARHEEVRRHRRRRRVAGLDGSDPRYQRQRQTRRVRRARPAARSQPRTSASTRRSMP